MCFYNTYYKFKVQVVWLFFIYIVNENKNISEITKITGVFC